MFNSPVGKLCVSAVKIMCLCRSVFSKWLDASDLWGISVLNGKPLIALENKPEIDQVKDLLFLTAMNLTKVLINFNIFYVNICKQDKYPMETE